MSFSGEDLALLDKAEEVRIETRAAAGRTHRTTIWIVVSDGVPYVRSVRGRRGRWYREVVDSPAAAIHVDGRRLEAKAAPAADPASVARVNAALETKYAGDPAVASMLRPETLETTLRLDPA